MKQFIMRTCIVLSLLLICYGAYNFGFRNGIKSQDFSGVLWTGKTIEIRNCIITDGSLTPENLSQFMKEHGVVFPTYVKNYEQFNDIVRKAVAGDVIIITRGTTYTVTEDEFKVMRTGPYVR
jgi:hypothetical protein